MKIFRKRTALRVLSGILLPVLLVLWLPAVGTFASEPTDFTFTETAGNLTITGYLGTDPLVSIPSSINAKPVAAIANYAFQTKPIQSVTIPGSVKTIGISAFYGCLSLQLVSLTSGLTTLGDNAFQDCKVLTSIIIPDSVTSLGANVFNGCSALQQVTLPSAITAIGNSLFYNCDSLVSFIVPDTVKTIGSNAFGACAKLLSVTLPSSVQTISTSAFSSRAAGFKIIGISDSSANTYATTNNIPFEVLVLIPKYYLEVSTVGAGSVQRSGATGSLPSNYRVLHNSNEQITLTATPDPGYEFAYW